MYEHGLEIVAEVTDNVVVVAVFIPILHELVGWDWCHCAVEGVGVVVVSVMVSEYLWWWAPGTCGGR